MTINDYVADMMRKQLESLLDGMNEIADVTGSRLWSVRACRVATVLEHWNDPE